MSEAPNTLFDPQQITSAEGERWLDEIERYEKQLAFHNEQMRVLMKRIKTRRDYLLAWTTHLRITKDMKTVDLPSARLQTRPEREKIVVTNPAKFEAWAIGAGYTKVAVDTKAAKAALKFQEPVGERQTGDAVDPKTGEIVEGIEKYVPAENTFTLSITRRD